MRDVQQCRSGNESDRRVLIIVQNLPVPFDRRVWLECQALRDAGYEVHVVCPKAPGDPRTQCIDGVDVAQVPAAPAGDGASVTSVEYAWSLLMTAWLTRARVRRRTVRHDPGVQPARHLLDRRPRRSAH